MDNTNYWTLKNKEKEKARAKQFLEKLAKHSDFVTAAHRSLGMDFKGKNAKNVYRSHVETVAQHLMEKLKDARF